MSLFINELTNEEKVLHCLKDTISSEELSENKILMRKYNLTVDFKIIKVKEYEKLLMVEIAFRIYHEFFDEYLIEVTAGVEENIDAAINQCVKNFTSSILEVVIKSLAKGYDEELEGDFFNSLKSYYLTKGSSKSIGEKKGNEEIDFWNLFHEKIKERLGNKKSYLIKIYASKLKSGDLSCECRINGIIDEEITEHLKNYSKDWEVITNFYSLKQFFVITQKDETYEKYPYSKEEVVAFTNKAIKILATCDNEEKFNNIDKEINEITKNENVSNEIRSFIPEIFCELVFSEASFSNRIIFVKDNEQIEGYKRQFTIYFWIYETVVNVFKERVLSENELKTIVSFSATYSSIAEALNNGKEIKDLNNILYGISGPKGYTPL